jgi:hypothetical protein
MTTTALKSMLHEKPFRPFSVVLSSGDRYPVRHPEMMWVLKDRALVAIEPKSADDEPAEFVTVSFLHIAATEPLPDRNGSKRSRH